MLSLVINVNEEFYIGKDGDLLYHIKDDLSRFKWLTSVPNSYLFMGRATWESLKYKPLPNRKNVIFTRSHKYKVEDKYKNNLNVMVEYDVEKVINHIKETGYNGDKNIFIIGGAELASSFTEVIDRIYLTLVHDNTKGDTYLNPYFLKDFRITHREKHFDEESGLHYSFINYKRKEKVNEQ